MSLAFFVTYESEISHLVHSIFRRYQHSFRKVLNLVTYNVHSWQYTSWELARFRVTSRNRIVAVGVRWRDDVMLDCRSPGGLQSLVSFDNNWISKPVYFHKQKSVLRKCIVVVTYKFTARCCLIDTSSAKNSDTWIIITHLCQFHLWWKLSDQRDKPFPLVCVVTCNSKRSLCSL
jgi:hypothetical protein